MKPNPGAPKPSRLAIPSTCSPSSPRIKFGKPKLSAPDPSGKGSLSELLDGRNLLRLSVSVPIAVEQLLLGSYVGSGWEDARSDQEREGNSTVVGERLRGRSIEGRLERIAGQIFEALVHLQDIGTGLPGGPGYEVPERLVLMQRHLTRDRVEVLVVDPQECGQEDVIHRHRQPELERGVSPRWRWNELKA